MGDDRISATNWCRYYNDWNIRSGEQHVLVFFRFVCVCVDVLIDFEMYTPDKKVQSVL